MFVFYFIFYEALGSVNGFCGVMLMVAFWEVGVGYGGFAAENWWRHGGYGMRKRDV